MPTNGRSFEQMVSEVMRKKGVDRPSAEKIVASQKRAQLKQRIAAVGINFDDKSKRREKVMNFRKSTAGQQMPKKGRATQRRLKQEVQHINTGAPISPTKQDQKINLSLRKKLAKEHHHSIVFKGHDLGMYRAASLEGQQGKYAKYWLLNAKQTNGNGWGIAAHTAKANMKKFIGRPLVVTSAKWHGASEYGDSFEHPYLPTNDIQQILGHQEKFRVGSIVDVGEKNGDFYATIEMLPKFANMTLPPFCSPAIYQLNAQEHEGNISEWEALHLAALDENPAYGARIALLKGTCVGTENACKVQFKSAKQLNATIMDEDVANKTKKTKKKKMFDKNNPRFRGIMEAQVVCPNKVASIQRKLDNLKKKQKVALKVFETGDDGRLQDSLNIISAGGADASKFKKQPKAIPNPTNKFRNLSNSKKDEVVGRVRENLLNKMNQDEGMFGGQTFEDTDNLLDFKDRKINDSFLGVITKGNKIKTKGKGTSLAKQKSAIDKRVNTGLGIISSGGIDASKIPLDRKPTDIENFTDRLSTLTKGRVDMIRKIGDITNDPTGIMQLERGEDRVVNPRAKKIHPQLSLGNILKKQDRMIKVKKNPTRGTSLAKLKAKLAIVRSPDKFKVDREMKHTRVDSAGPLINKVPFGDEDRSTTQQYIDRQMRDSSYELSKGKKVRPPKPTQKDRKRIIKAKLASLGEQNMTYQNSKKVKIHKKKHPEVRKAKGSVDDILRKTGRSVDASHEQSTWLSQAGDFIGGGGTHTEQVNKITGGPSGETENQIKLDKFTTDTGLIRVQNFPINRAGEKRTSVGITSKVNRNQLKAIEDLEIGGRDIGYAVGSGDDISTGRGYKDLTKTLRERGLL